MKYSTLLLVALFGAAKASTDDPSLLRSSATNDMDSAEMVSGRQPPLPDQANKDKSKQTNKPEVPPGLVDNPGKAIGVQLKKGAKPKNQRAKADQTIEDLDGDVVDLKTLKPINMFSQEKFELSSDGTYVTNKETGEKQVLEVFGNLDVLKKNQDVADEDTKVIFATKTNGVFDDIRIHPGKGKGLSQSFKKTGEFFVGYSDDDVDVDEIANHFKPGSIVAPGKEGESDDKPTSTGRNLRNHRKLITPKFTYLPFPTINSCSRLPSIWYRNVVTVGVTVNSQFQGACASRPWWCLGLCCDKKYGTARAQAIFNEANFRYWYSGCALLTVGYWDTVGIPSYGTTSGCDGSPGVLQNYKDDIQERHGNSKDVDVWHLFTGVNFTDGNNVGCAWYRGACRGNGYGVNHMTFTNDVGAQGTLFAHELGHNLGSEHSSSGNGVMGSYLKSGGALFESGSNTAMQNHIAAYCS